MSKNLPSSYFILAVAAAILQFFTNTAAQDIDVRIELLKSGSAVRVNGRFLSKAKERNLSFLRSHAGFKGLRERIGSVSLKDDKGVEVGRQEPVSGEFVAEAPFSDWSYSIDLSPRKEQNAAAHISWVTNDSGLLMLGDILPAFETGSKTAAKITIVLPDGWRQMENRVDGIILTKDAASEVVAVGKNIRFRKAWVGNTSITICIQGDWLFTGDDITNFGQRIYGQLRSVFNSDPTNDVLVNAFRFPQNPAPGQWQAETRGRNITIISSDMPFKTQSLQRLHEQLRHEMFHLWIPNGLNLSGNYDWFYEGFALYQSLKTAVDLNQIRFDDFLDTLSRAQSIDARQTRRLSLIDASKDRWEGADTYIYARGMITAFLCDVLVLHNSKGKRSVTDIFSELYATHRYPNARTDGNAAVLAILQNKKELTPIVHRYINGPERFEWQPEITLAGLETKGAHNLSVLPKLDGRQKEILNKLGYNNWRKIGN